MKCNNCEKPKNGLYYTPYDFDNWQNIFSQRIHDNYINTKFSLDENDKTNIRVKNISIVVTEKCNLNCTYCYQSHEKHNNGITMNKETAKRIVDQIFDKEKINGYYNFEQSRGVILDFIGGEPLIQIDVIDYFVDYFKYKQLELNHEWAYNYMISISSNGVSYFNKKVQKFFKKNDKRISFGISLDGNKKLHDQCRVFPNGKGSYDIVEKQVKTEIQKKQKVTTKLTIHPDNLDYLYESIKHLHNLGIQGIYQNPVYENVWKNNNQKSFYNLLKQTQDYLLDGNYKTLYLSLFDETIGKYDEKNINYCGGQGEMLQFDIKGRMFPCIRFMEYSLLNKEREETPIGDLEKGINKNDPFLKTLNKITKKSQSTKKCIDCPIQTGCGWCTGFNYDYYGDPNKRATFTCEMHQQRVLQNQYYWNKLYKKLRLNKKFELNIPKDWQLKIIDETEYKELKGEN